MRWCFWWCGSDPPDRMGKWAAPPLWRRFCAAATVIISFAGALLEWKNQPEMAAVILEGVFICGAVILLGRAMHLVLNWRFEPREAEKKERGNEERLRGYAESFQGLSQVFYTMSNRKEAYDAGELGQIQNELTGKICANCDSCALCWERDPAPLYTVLSGMITNIWNGGIREDEGGGAVKAILCEKQGYGRGSGARV